MDRYVEVVGEGQYVETAVRFIADVTLEVRAARDETAQRGVGELWDEALTLLRDAGILDDEIVDGGGELQRPWYAKRQAGQIAVRKIVLRVADSDRLTHALELLEPLQVGHEGRRTISVAMCQPEFADEGDGRAMALAIAFRDAQTKASRLVEAMNGRLGQPIQVTEVGMSRRNSGCLGDPDWSGDASRFDASHGVVLMAGESASQPEPATPTRTVFVKCRVRFALVDAE